MPDADKILTETRQTPLFLNWFHNKNNNPLILKPSSLTMSITMPISGLKWRIYHKSTHRLHGRHSFTRWVFSFLFGGVDIWMFFLHMDPQWGLGTISPITSLHGANMFLDDLICSSSILLFFEFTHFRSYCISKRLCPLLHYLTNTANSLIWPKS